VETVGNVTRSFTAPEGRHKANPVPFLRGLLFCLHTYPAVETESRVDSLEAMAESI